MNCNNFKGYRCNVERYKTQVKQKNSLGETGTQLCKKKCENNPDCKGFYTRIPKGYKKNTMCYLCTGKPNPDKSFRRSSSVKDYNICQRGVSGGACRDCDKDIEKLEHIIDTREQQIKELEQIIRTYQQNTPPPDNGSDVSGGPPPLPSPSTGLPIAVTIWTDPGHQHKNIISKVGFEYNNSEIVLDNAPDKTGDRTYDQGSKFRRELPRGGRITKIIAQQGWGLDCLNFYTQKRNSAPVGQTMGPHVATQLKNPKTKSGGTRYIFQSTFDDPIINIKRRMGKNQSLFISQRDSTWWGGPIEYVITKSGKHIYPTISYDFTQWCK